MKGAERSCHLAALVGSQSSEGPGRDRLLWVCKCCLPTGIAGLLVVSPAPCAPTVGAWMSYPRHARHVISCFCFGDGPANLPCMTQPSVRQCCSALVLVFTITYHATKRLLLSIVMGRTFALYTIGILYPTDMIDPSIPDYSCSRLLPAAASSGYGRHTGPSYSG